MNRALNQRSDVTGEVLEAHIAGFEEPTDENPFIVDADETNGDALAKAHRFPDPSHQPTLSRSP